MDYYRTSLSKFIQASHGGLFDNMGTGIPLLNDEYLALLESGDPEAWKYLQDNAAYNVGMLEHMMLGNKMNVNWSNAYRQQKKKEILEESSGAVPSESNTKDMYRAVGIDEYYDIMSTKQFRGIEGKTLVAKEFGNDFKETLDFANRSINIDKVAIIKVTIPENVYNQLNHMNLDPSIFKSGTPVVEPDMLKYFNDSIISIEHFY